MKTHILVLGSFSALLMLSASNSISAADDSGNPPSQSDTVYEWYDSFKNKGQSNQDERTISVPEFPDTVFLWKNDTIYAVKNGEESPLVSGMPIFSAYFTDLNGDGYPELCASVAFGSGIIDSHISVYDIHNQAEYYLWDRMVYDYTLEKADGQLIVHKQPYYIPYGDSYTGETGRLDLRDKLVFLPDSTLLPPHSGTPSVTGDVNNDGAFSIADIVLLQKWLLGSPNVELPNWKAADMCEDGILNVFDLCMMRAELNRTAPPVKRQITTDDIIELSRSGYSLTMADFAGFQGKDIGSGLYVMEYEVSGGKFRLLVGSGNCTDIIYANLEVVNGRQMTDIRDGDIEEFIVRFSE